MILNYPRLLSFGPSDLLDFVLRAFSTLAVFPNNLKFYQNIKVPKSKVKSRKTVWEAQNGGREKSNLWQHLATFGKLWQLLATFATFYSVFSNYWQLWQLLATFSHFCNFLQLF